jgi:putative DNA primase/helicase
VHRDIIARIKQAADCRSIFKRFWLNDFRERGNCFCPFHDDSKSSLHQEFFEFVPEFKIVLSTNHKPSIRGTDTAIWSRIHLVPFDVTIPKCEQIPRTVMLERLKKEWPGILAWAVQGCIAWQKEGLEKPAEIERATSDYRADSDILGGFITDCCIVNPLGKCRSTELYAQYQK